MLLIRNDRDLEIEIDPVEDTSSVNGIEMGVSAYGIDVSPNKYCIMEIEVSANYLETHDIKEITEASLYVEINDENYDEVANTTLYIKTK